MVRPNSITEVQALLGDPKLTKLLIWGQSGNRVVAKPKSRLSRTVFREILKKFREMGGGYTGYFGFTVELEKKDKE